MAARSTTHGTPVKSCKTSYPEFKQSVSFNDSVEALSILCSKLKPELKRRTDYPGKRELSLYSLEREARFGEGEAGET